MERIEKMRINENGGYKISRSYKEDADIIAALNRLALSLSAREATINLTLVTASPDGRLVYTDVEDAAIDDIRVINGEVFYDPAE